MKTLLVLAALCACTLADSLYGYNAIPYSSVYPHASYTPYVSTYNQAYNYPHHQAQAKTAVIPNVLPSGLNKQYQSQDNLGQFSFGYTNPQSARSEVKSADGTVAGQYSYVQPQGNVVQVKYVADSQGYRVEDNVPRTVGFRYKRDTEEAEKTRDARQVYYTPAVTAYQYPAHGYQYGVYPQASAVYPVAVQQQQSSIVKTVPAVVGQSVVYNPTYGHYGYPAAAVVPVVTGAAQDSLVKGQVSASGSEYPKTVVHA